MGKLKVKKGRRRKPPAASAPTNRKITWERLSSAIQKIALERGHLAGYPLPVEGHSLQLYPGFPYPGVARYWTSDGKPEPAVDCLAEGEQVRNAWYSKRLRQNVWILETPAGLELVVDRKPDAIARLDLTMATAHASLAWRLEPELTAMTTLAQHISAHAFKCYATTGSFVESSPRSGVFYLFRRLRPTIAMKESGGVMRFLAALCLHPIGYYTGTHAGSMVPTDDVIAHLLMMRADEHLFWRRSNQHPLWAPEAGI